ncbi:hypothetical protein IQ07DRAFT_430498 [Pyrenochaeta sp. DS3sAY3a]|nr:hypothetical protein IQ07DRAFT_430498 [Pyrenochaeta sp. DS3sAY3a]
MSTAPPTTRMPLFTDPLHLHPASSYLSPASTIASDSSFSWISMPPQQETHVPTRRKKSKSPTAAAQQSTAQPSNELRFITGSTPAELRSTQNMTIVRKTAMASFLKSEKKQRKDKSSKGSDRSRLNSEASDKSPASIASTEVYHDAAGQQPHRQGTQASPVESPMSARRDQSTPSSEMQVTRLQRSGISVLAPAPIVEPMRTNVVLPYNEHNPAPLVSIGKSLDPFRTMFQASNPHVSVEELKFHCSRYFGTRGLGKYWIPTCLKYPHTFLSTLCLASAHHDIVHELPVESLATTALRQEIIHLVGGNMLNPDKSVADHNIVAVTQLIIGEVIGRKEAGLVWHEAGVETMIKQRGGLNQLGMDGRLASSISWVSLASAILQETKPRTMYADYCASKSRKNYPATATIPESPIYCPRNKFVTVQRSTGCKKPEALDLLVDIRMMIDIFLHETKQSRRNSQTLLNLYKKITNDYIPISELRKSNVILSPSDWKYEAIRITAVLQATAIIRRIPLSEALIFAASPRKLSSLYTSSIASRSSDSLVSPYDVRHDTPVTEYSTSPSYSTYSTSPALQQSGFPFGGQRPSFSSTTSSIYAQRPSFSSTHSNSSDRLYLAPLPQAAPSPATSLLRSLKNALEDSNLSDCWADMAGVLFWIGLVMGAASRKSENKILKNYYSATAMRAGIMLCFEHPEAIHASVLRMSEVVEGLSPENKSEVARKNSDAAGKRRRA